MSFSFAFCKQTEIIQIYEIYIKYDFIQMHSVLSTAGHIGITFSTQLLFNIATM